MLLDRRNSPGAKLMQSSKALTLFGLRYTIGISSLGSKLVFIVYLTLCVKFWNVVDEMTIMTSSF